MLKVKDIMTNSVITVSPNESLQHAVELMASSHISCLIAVDGGRPVGILSERDLVLAISRQSEQAGITLADILSEPTSTNCNGQQKPDTYSGSVFKIFPFEFERGLIAQC